MTFLTEEESKLVATVGNAESAALITATSLIFKERSSNFVMYAFIEAESIRAANVSIPESRAAFNLNV